MTEPALPDRTLPDRTSVEAAAERLAGRVLETPVIHRESFSRWLGCEVHFKCETFQRTGSFKFRGATHAVGQLGPDALDAGVTTHSSGNHGAALALAARDAGLPARIVVPRGANPLKRAAIEAYGGRIVECGETLAEREAALARVCQETGAIFVPPYDDAHIIAGQGTAALELARSVPGLDEVWVPVGGGGLASGTLLALAGESVRVIGVEPELADDAYWSLERGEIQPQRPPRTIADGLRTALGTLPFALFRQHHLTIRTVTEAEIVAAQRLLWQRLKLVVELSGAVPLAGLLRALAAEPARYSKVRVGVILSGGNAVFPEPAV
ncbi:MAG: threonine/serine dehydratase [Pseudomonadales bacterium]